MTGVQTCALPIYYKRQEIRKEMQTYIDKALLSGIRADELREMFDKCIDNSSITRMED